MFLTDFADAAVTLPLALVLLLAVAHRAGTAVAAAWTLPIGASFALILGGKLVFGVLPLLPGVNSPSGHTAGATVVYAALLRLAGGGRAATLAAAILVAAAVGASRVALGMHTPAEVVIGALAGLAGVALLVRAPPVRLRHPGVVAAAVVAVALLQHGRHAPFEVILRHWCACLANA